MRRANVFIVHVWIDDGSAPFRAAVQCADSDESGWFTDAAALVRYFEARAVADIGATSDAGTQRSSRKTT